MILDISKFFELEAADIHENPLSDEVYYDVLLTSKSTGEVITFTFDEAHFDELLRQMTTNLIMRYCEYYDIPIIREKGNFI